MHNQIQSITVRAVYEYSRTLLSSNSYRSPDAPRGKSSDQNIDEYS